VKGYVESLKAVIPLGDEDEAAHLAAVDISLGRADLGDQLVAL
jgi:hypothetical protein